MIPGTATFTFIPTILFTGGQASTLDPYGIPGVTITTLPGIVPIIMITIIRFHTGTILHITMVHTGRDITTGTIVGIIPVVIMTEDITAGREHPLPRIQCILQVMQEPPPGNLVHQYIIQI